MPQFLELPGPWIDGDNRDVASHVQLYLSQVVSAFNEAVVAQRSFEALNQRHLRALSTAEPRSLSRSDGYRRLIYAKAFVFALDELRQYVGVIARLPSIPEAARGFCRQYAAESAVVRRIRNSLHHPDERIQGIGPRNSRIDAAVRGLTVTIESSIGATTERGIVEKLPVTHDYLEGIKSDLLKLIWTFPWLGPGNQRLERNNNGQTS